MVGAYVPLLLLLAAIWGASYRFVKVVVEEDDSTCYARSNLMRIGRKAEVGASP